MKQGGTSSLFFSQTPLGFAPSQVCYDLRWSGGYGDVSAAKTWFAARTPLHNKGICRTRPKANRPSFSQLSVGGDGIVRGSFLERLTKWVLDFARYPLLLTLPIMSHNYKSQRQSQPPPTQQQRYIELTILTVYDNTKASPSD